MLFLTLARLETCSLLTIGMNARSILLAADGVQDDVEMVTVFSQRCDVGFPIRIANSQKLSKVFE